ncbi:MULTISPECIES: NAD(P)/FAD-dependent oxidoreductase [Bacillus]|uniref:NAD(P)/FAD-dependent oxidoreductase n=1 Tax=Bacillus TaxID=1386 RepID=UPI00030B934B|nr:MULTISPECIES: NAD(P)/FAD-dependent oxidoreductase [Bacillus]
MKKTRIVILGAGYGGLITSKTLEKALKNDEAEVTLINKHNYHYISTQLHKTGAGTASDEKIILSIPELLNANKINFKQATVTSVDKEAQKVQLSNGEEVEYDTLLISLGFDVDTFGIPGVEENAFKIRSFRSTKAIFHHIHNEFEGYQKDKDPSRLTFVVAGAGFTGIEMVGELIEVLPKLCKQYNVPVEAAKIVNVEASNSILPGFDQAAIEYSTNYIKKNGVELLTSSKIVKCTSDTITLDNGKELASRTLIWSGGVRGNRLLEKMDLPTTRGRIEVDEFLRVKGYENIFCLGDASAFITKENKQLLPTAQVAIQQAQHCGKNIAKHIRKESLTAFEYHHKGTVASIGTKTAVGKVGPMSMKGLFAAFMKQVIEIRYLFVLGGPSLVVKQMFKGNKVEKTETVTNK